MDIHTKMECPICRIDTISYKQIETEIIVKECPSCSLKISDLKSIDNIKKSHSKEFWQKDNYKNFIGTNFSDKKVLDLVLSWNSWYSTCEEFFEGKRILDIGSGTGISLVKFEERGFEVKGIEPDPENVEKINQILKKGICENGFIEDFDTTERFDIIWSSHSLEHMKDPNICFQKALKFLKDKGIFCVIVPDGDNPFSIKESSQNRFHIYHYSKESLKKLGESYGFKIEYISSYKIMKRNFFRIHKILRKIYLQKLSVKLGKFFPFEETIKNDGNEIRVIFRKS